MVKGKHAKSTKLNRKVTRNYQFLLKSSVALTAVLAVYGGQNYVQAEETTGSTAGQTIPVDTSNLAQEAKEKEVATASQSAASESVTAATSSETTASTVQESTDSKTASTDNVAETSTQSSENQTASIATESRMDRAADTSSTAAPVYQDVVKVDELKQTAEAGENQVAPIEKTSDLLYLTNGSKTYQNKNNFVSNGQADDNRVLAKNGDGNSYLIYEVDRPSKVELETYYNTDKSYAVSIRYTLQNKAALNFKIFTSSDKESWEEQVVTVPNESGVRANPAYAYLLQTAADIPETARYLKVVFPKFNGVNYYDYASTSYKAVKNIDIELGKVKITQKDPNEPLVPPTELKKVGELKVSEDGKYLEIPASLEGDIAIVGTNAYGVIDTDGNVFTPLTNQKVKVSVSQTKDGQTVTKEFTVNVRGQHADEGVGVAPTVAPVVQQWYGREGTSSITTETALISGEFSAAADLYKKDLAARGLMLESTNDAASSRIEFHKVLDKGYGKEGYGISIDDGIIRIEAADKVGAFYATRTLLQMGEANLQNGDIRDYPSFEHRGFMLDSGRKFIPYDVVMQVLDNMAYYKLNDFQLHLNDNFIFLKEHLAGKTLTKEEELQYVLEHAAEGFRLETDIVGENGKKLTSEDHYTKEQFQNIIKHAAELGINLVPEIDTPGHALSFVKIRPDLMYSGDLASNHHNVERVAMLDLENKYDETLAFVKSVYNKLLDGDDAILKGVKTIHIGTDEYYGSSEAFRRYTNDMIAFIKSKGLTPRVWGSLSQKTGKTPVDLKGVEVDIWNTWWQDPQAALNAGAKIINITDNPTYSVPDGTGTVGLYKDISDYRRQYDKWTPNDYGTSGKGKFNESDPNIFGGSYAIWNDNIDLRERGITSQDLFLRFFKVLPVTSERTWGSDRAPRTYAERQELSDTIKYAPRTNPEYKLAADAYFNLTKDTLEHYSSHNVVKGTALTFAKDSWVTTKADKVGLDHTLTIDVKPTGEGVQVFSTDGKNKIYLVDEEGRVAYTFENYHIQFDTKLKPNKRVQLKFVNRLQETDLYVDNVLQGRVVNPAHPRLDYTTFIMPLGTIGGFEGTLYEASLANEVFKDPSKVTREDYASISASSEHTPNTDGEGEIGLAFDGSSKTYWHSHWEKKDDTYTVELNLKEPALIKALTYLPRQNTDNNGIVTSYEIYANVEGQLVKVDKGQWSDSRALKTANFEIPAKTNQIVFKILQAANGYASAAEIALVKDGGRIVYDDLDQPSWKYDEVASQPSVQPETPSQPSDQPATPSQPNDQADQPTDTDQSQPSENDTTANKEIADKLVEERQVNFNKDWYFKLNPVGDQSDKGISVEDWKKLDLPHDWSIFFDFNHKSAARNEGGQLDGGVAWYRKDFTLEPDQQDKNVRIQFDGVYMDSQVYVNGKFVGSYPNGYNQFSYDITNYLTKDGSENVIAVKVTNKQPSSRWYSGSGIYRDVHLLVTDKVHVARNGNYITSPSLKEQKDSIVDTKVATKVVNTSQEEASVYVEHQIFKKGGEAVTGLLKSATRKLAANQEFIFKQSLGVDRPVLWTIHSDSPQLYTLQTRVFKNGQLVDAKEDTFGYRYMDWTAEEGFFLNGEKTKFHGVSIHHDNGALGAEENYKATYRKLKRLKEMGVNSIRTTHNPASQELLDIAQEIGLLVQEEAFDTWYGGKKTYDYGRFFDLDATHPEAKAGEKWSDFDLRTMIEKDRNNPAIIMWSLGNEVDEANGDARSVETVKRLVRDVKALDTERYVTMGENKYSYSSGGNFEKVQNELDVVGMNYGEHNYAKVRQNHPTWKIYGSETSSATRTRGAYFYPNRKVVHHDNSAARNYEQSDYGNDTVNWGRTATESWTFDRNTPGYAGQFIWTGWDYIGEPTPWHNQDETPVKSSFFGIVDTAGIPKNDYYLYTSQWRNAEDHPMVHILPHWNWEDEKLASFVKTSDGKIPVRTFSNAASVELFLNGQSLGKKEFTVKTTSDGRSYQEGAAADELYLEWLVNYTPGTLEAVARDREGNEIARDKVATAGAPAGVRFEPEEHVITADGKDLSYIIFNIVDADGNLVPTANNLVHFNLHGQGEIVGVDNGQEASRERYKAQADGSWERRAFNGKGLIIVKSTERDGKFTVYADSRGLKSDQATITTVKEGNKEHRFLSYQTIKQSTTKGVDPTLPNQILVIYTDGQTESKNVTWSYDHSLVETAGLKTIQGKVDGIENAPTLELQVVGIKSFLPVVKKVAVHSKESAISKAVVAVLTDGSLKVVTVPSWNLADASKLAEEGSRIAATSQVDGHTVEATVVVSNAKSPALKPLASITVGGQELADFASDRFDYRVNLPYGVAAPLVAAQASDDSIIAVDQATVENNHRAVVYLISSVNGKRTSYTVQFVEAAPAIRSVEIKPSTTENLKVDQVIPFTVIGHYEDGSQIVFDPSDVKIESSSTDGGRVLATKDSLQLYDAGHVIVKAYAVNQSPSTQSLPLELSIAENPEVKTIVKLSDVAVSVDRREEPILPSEITADYDKGLSRKVAVVWDKVDADDLADYHSFTVQGTVAGTNLKARATITVEGVLAVEEVSVTTPKGERPNLPESVRVYYSDGTTIYRNVNWDTIAENVIQEDGSFEVLGQVEGSKFTTKAHVRVSSQVVRGANITKQWTGSKIPAAFASFTGGTDHASKLNDTTVSYTVTPDNRWTNWKANREEDFVGILFGDAGDLTKRYVDNLHVDFYTDTTIALPVTYEIEYYVGDLPKVPEDLDFVSKQVDHPFNNPENWRSVSHLKLRGASITEYDTNDFTFDKVETYAIRLRMTKRDDKNGVGVTELTAYASQVKPETSAQVSLTVDGQVIPNFDSTVKEYHLPKLVDEPHVVASVTNNGLATIIPSTAYGTPVRVIVKAEDGKVISEYKLYFEGQEKTFVDETTSIKAVVPASASPSIVKLVVEDKDEVALTEHSNSIKELNLDLYDIKFVNQTNQEVSVRVPVKVTMPTRAGKTVEQVLFFDPTTDKIETVAFTQTGDSVEFTTSHFSIYGLTYAHESHVGSMLAGEVNGPTVAILPEFDLSSLDSKEEPLQVHVGSMLAGELNGPTVSILPEFDLSSLDPKEEPLQVHVGSMLAGEVNGPTVAILPEFDISSLELPKSVSYQAPAVEIVAPMVKGKVKTDAKELPMTGTSTSLLGALGMGMMALLGGFISRKKKG